MYPGVIEWLTEYCCMDIGIQANIIATQLKFIIKLWNCESDHHSSIVVFVLDIVNCHSYTVSNYIDNFEPIYLIDL